jgi:tetratricopeptide (TPR) repeat protein
MKNSKKQQSKTEYRISYLSRIPLKLYLFCFVLFIANTGLAFADGKPIQLDTAIKKTSEEITAVFQQGHRLVVEKFDTEASELSEYIIEELTGALIRESKVIIIDRHNLEYVKKELYFQESGLISGTAYGKKGNYTLARADYRKVLQLDPNDTLARENLELLR